MKIKDLIEELNKLPQNAEIATYDYDEEDELFDVYDVNKIVTIKQMENNYGKEDLRKIDIKKVDYILCIGNQYKNFR
ncbi:hypothetical protein FDA09_16925 [Clostridium botulinum]|uniref:hypothetical protein n=1 Tax=Clostridium botulinum TaxID=1491 RepID=UPI0007731F70|nr:hypothetical protein [Clostridium botulinum]NFH81784.1 hypothetical protein [Clostridium botulinum]NFH85039.1 hypothetical protein [Clostridium botulinum]NFI13024.1 hypothetical protein [Clostridium botulinum]NFI16279.1 hypothetical protein [Clostridium botulinum]NFO86038.1 hypothetical protein [Clostridium botulinum]